MAETQKKAGALQHVLAKEAVPDKLQQLQVCCCAWVLGWQQILEQMHQTLCAGEHELPTLS